MNWNREGRLIAGNLIFIFGFLSSISLSRWWHGQVLLRYLKPLVSFFDQHDGYALNDRILAPAILANQPAILFTHTIRAAQDIQEFFTDHSVLLWWEQ